jgi:hypothetical protein
MNYVSHSDNAYRMPSLVSACSPNLRLSPYNRVTRFRFTPMWFQQIVWCLLDPYKSLFSCLRIFWPGVTEKSYVGRPYVKRFVSSR